VAALVPQAELDGLMGDNQVGLQARLMSKAMRKLVAVLNRSSCTIIFINQLREKVGIVYGNPETTSGGRALIFTPPSALTSAVQRPLKTATICR
jgi:recombination protein RecA